MPNGQRNNSMTREQALRKLLEQASVGMTLAADLLQHGYQAPSIGGVASSLGTAYMQSDAQWVNALDTLSDPNQVRELIPQEFQTRDVSTKVGALNFLLDQQEIINNVARRLGDGQSPARIGASISVANIRKVPKLARAALTLKDEFQLTDNEWAAFAELNEAAEEKSGMSDLQMHKALLERFKNIFLPANEALSSSDVLVDNASSGALNAFLRDGDQRLIKMVQRQLDDPELRDVIICRADAVLGAVNAFNGVDLAKEMLASQWNSHEQTILPIAAPLFNDAYTNPMSPVIRGEDGINRIDMGCVFSEHRDPQRVIQSPAVRAINSRDLHRSNFGNLQANNMSLRDFNFSESTFPYRTVFAHSDLQGSDFTNSRIEKNIDMTSAILDPKALESLLPSVRRANERLNAHAPRDDRKVLLNVKLVGDFSGMDFSGLDMRGADFQQADLSRVNLDGTRLEMANMTVKQLSTASNIDKADFGQDLMLQQESGQLPLPEAALRIKRQQDLTRVADRVVMYAEEGILEIPMMYGVVHIDLPQKERHLDPKTRNVMVEIIADRLYHNIWEQADLPSEVRESSHIALVQNHKTPIEGMGEKGFADIMAAELLHQGNITLVEDKPSRLKKSVPSLFRRNKSDATNVKGIHIVAENMDEVGHIVDNVLPFFVQVYDGHQTEVAQAAQTAPPGIWSKIASSVTATFGMMAKDAVGSVSDMRTTNILPEVISGIPGTITQKLRQWVGTEQVVSPEKEREATIKDTVHQGVHQAILGDMEGPLNKKGRKLQNNLTQMVMEKTSHITPQNLPEDTVDTIAKTLRDHKVVEPYSEPGIAGKVKYSSINRSSNSGMSWASKVVADKLEQRDAPSRGG